MISRIKTYLKKAIYFYTQLRLAEVMWNVSQTLWFNFEKWRSFKNFIDAIYHLEYLKGLTPLSISFWIPAVGKICHEDWWHGALSIIKNDWDGDHSCFDYRYI